MNSIKFVFNGNEILSDQVPDDFPRLASLVEKLLPHIQVNRMKYEDEDGDLVTIAGTPDLFEALSQCEKQGRETLVVLLEGIELTNSFMTSGIREVAQMFSKPTTLLKKNEDFVGSLSIVQSVILEDPAENQIQEAVSEVLDSSVVLEKSPERASEPIAESEKMPEETYITECFKCSGKGQNKKGGPCKICEASGSFDMMKKPQLRKIIELIRTEVHNTVGQMVASMREEEQAVHYGVRCDNCGVVPLTGPRYKCTVCHDFDFCSNCEASQPHEHPFLKIKTPAQAPRTMITVVDENKEQKRGWRPLYCNRGGFGKKLFGGFGKFLEQGCKRKNRQAEADTRLGCRFVKDVVGRDGDYHAPGASFLKTWKLRNAGTNSWPRGCKLVFVNGDFSGGPVDLPPLQPNEECDVTARCTAPKAEGRYNSFWRAVDNEGTRFGQRIWIMINVGTPVESDCAAQLELLKEFCYNDPERVREVLVQARGDLSLAVELALGQ